MFVLYIKHVPKAKSTSLYMVLSLNDYGLISLRSFTELRPAIANENKEIVYISVHWHSFPFESHYSKTFQRKCIIVPTINKIMASLCYQEKKKILYFHNITKSIHSICRMYLPQQMPVVASKVCKISFVLCAELFALRD